MIRAFSWRRESASRRWQRRGVTPFPLLAPAVLAFYQTRPCAFFGDPHSSFSPLVAEIPSMPRIRQVRDNSQSGGSPTGRYVSDRSPLIVRLWHLVFIGTISAIQ
jgi:hypothetical protein